MQLRATRGWSVEKTAEVFLIDIETGFSIRWRTTDGNVEIVEEDEVARGRIRNYDRAEYYTTSITDIHGNIIGNDLAYTYI